MGGTEATHDSLPPSSRAPTCTTLRVVQARQQRRLALKRVQVGGCAGRRARRGSGAGAERRRSGASTPGGLHAGPTVGQAPARSFSTSPAPLAPNPRRGARPPARAHTARTRGRVRLDALHRHLIHAVHEAAVHHPEPALSQAPVGARRVLRRRGRGRGRAGSTSGWVGARGGLASQQDGFMAGAGTPSGSSSSSAAAAVSSSGSSIGIGSSSSSSRRQPKRQRSLRLSPPGK